MHLRENEFERATELFYEAAAVPELWPSALQTVAHACGALGINLLPVGPGLEAFVCSPGIHEYMDDVLASGWLAANPYMRRGMELTAAGWRGLITSEDMLTPEQASRDPYINEHRRPGGLGSEAGVLLINTTDVAMPITIVRSRADEPFSRAEVSRLNRLMAQIRPAAVLALNAGFMSARMLADSFSRTGRDIALLGPSGRLIHMSPGLEHRLGGALALRGGVLRSWHHSTDRALAHAIQQAVSQEPAGRRAPKAVPLPRRHSRRPLMAQVVPITGAGQDVFMLARAALILTDPDVGNPVDAVAEALAAMGLTPAEVRLAKRIGQGEELKDIADAERIAVETARARLKAVFAKTGTHRQAQLAVFVARLSR